MRFENCSIPNCVPEYYRSKWEDEAREAEKEMERMSWYEKNKAYQEKRYDEGCWLVSFYPDECEKCEHGEEANPTAEWDDVPTKICDNWRNCPVFKSDLYLMDLTLIIPLLLIAPRRSMKHLEIL